jgi:hypothetical protein
MTVRSTYCARGRTRDARPVPARVFQKPLSEWYAEWRASKARTAAAAPTPAPVR